MKTKDQSILDQFQSKRQSIEDRIAAGKELRKTYPRILHGEYKPAADRAEDTGQPFIHERRSPDLLRRGA